MQDNAAIAIQSWLCRQDQDAAAWLVHEHRPQVLRVARAWGAPAWMEDDVVQEVFLRVFRALPRFEPRVPFAHWLAVIARNTCAKLRRHWCHRRRLSACFEEGAHEITEATDRAAAAPDALLMRNEHLARLSRSLAELSEKERELLGDSSSARSPAQRMALHRARKKLRVLFHQP